MQDSWVWNLDLVKGQEIEFELDPRAIACVRFDMLDRGTSDAWCLTCWIIGESLGRQ